MSSLLQVLFELNASWPDSTETRHSGNESVPLPISCLRCLFCYSVWSKYNTVWEIDSQSLRPFSSIRIPFCWVVPALLLRS